MLQSVGSSRRRVTVLCMVVLSVLAVWFVLASLTQADNSAEVKVGSAFVAPSAITTVPVIVSPGGTKFVSGVMVDVSFDPTAVTPTSCTPGAGVVRIVMVDAGGVTGTAGSITFLAAAAATGKVVLGASVVVCEDETGAPLSCSAIDGSITICPDNDGDTLCDAADPDDDNDGMPDSFENVHPCLDPLVDDAAADPDGDGRTNLEEFAMGSKPCVANVVGGVAELPEVAGAPLEAPDSSGSNTGLLAGVAGAVAAGTLTLGGAAWYARRRWS